MQETAPAAAKLKLDNGAISGIAIGGAVLLGAVAFVLWWQLHDDTNKSTTAVNCCSEIKRCGVVRSQPGMPNSYGADTPDGYVTFEEACSAVDGKVSVAPATLDGHDVTSQLCRCTCSKAIGPDSLKTTILMPDLSQRDPSVTASTNARFYTKDNAGSYRSALSFCCSDAGCATGSPICSTETYGAYQCKT